MNSYSTTVNPYFAPISPQEQQGLSPVFQNIAQQQANQNMAMQQGNQLTQQAGQTTQGSGNNMLMAALLRKKDSTKPAPITDNSEMMPNLDLGYNNLV